MIRSILAVVVGIVVGVVLVFLAQLPSYFLYPLPEGVKYDDSAAIAAHMATLGVAASPNNIVITSGELVMPVGQKVKLNITSRDVIHSFWIPRLNGKKDAVPGRIHPLWMEADQPGLYDGQCTEFCGLSHANMRMAVAALNDADWKQWVAGQTQPSAKPADNSPAAAGYAAFGRCVSCHQNNGYTDAAGKQIVAQPGEQLVSGAAPNLTHLMSRSTFAGGSFDLMTEACRQALIDAKPADFGQMYLKGSAGCLKASVG